MGSPSRMASSPIRPRIRRKFAWAGGLSILAWAALRALSPGTAIPWTPRMLDAAGRMDAALAAVAQHCREEGIPVERGTDPNRSCLVGPEYSELFTSLGQLEAKRTTANPDVAGLLTYFLSEAGVGEGDGVAVGASGSFPALLIATLAAVEALGAEPVTILSLGSSSFGATRPAFHLLDLYRLLQVGGFVSDPPAAISLGGSRDVGGGFDPGFREELYQELLESGMPVLRNPELRASVQKRMSLYDLGLGGRAPAVFVNIGGAEVNLGTSPKILSVPPGLVPWGDRPDPSQPWFRDLPPENERGVLFEMASRGVPVVHLLHIRGLVLRYGLPWDPIPLPAVGSASFQDAQMGKGKGFWLLSIGYFGALALVALSRGRTGGSFPGEKRKSGDGAATR